MSNEKLTAHLIPHLRLTWKKVRKGYQAQFALALPLPEYDIRREPGPLTGEKIMQAAFEGVRKTSKRKQPGRRVKFADGAEIGLDVRNAHLELRWERLTDGDAQWMCHYELIMPTIDGKRMHAVLGGTRRTSGGEVREPIDHNGEVDTPFRDSAHARWDGETLGLRAWAVYGEKRTEVKQVTRPAVQAAVAEGNKL